MNYLYDKLYYNFSENICLQNDEKDIFEFIVYCILFTYSRKNFIFFIQDNISKVCKLARIEQFDFIQEIKNNIENKTIKFIENEQNPNEKKIINEVVCILNDSFLFVLTKKIGAIRNEKLKEYFNLLLSIYNEDLNFERDYNLYSSQIFQLKSIIDLFIIVENEDDLGDKMQTFISFMEEELKLSINGGEDGVEKLLNLFDKEFQFFNSFSQNEQFYEYLISILINKYKSFIEIEIQNKITENILLNLGLLKNSYHYLFLIFENFDYSGEFLKNDNALNLMNNLNMPEINKKIFHLILLNIFNEIILENNSEYFNNGKPNKNFFIENYEKFKTYMEYLNYKEYENKQNAIFIKIYYD